jgi:hypothetical protein
MSKHLAILATFSILTFSPGLTDAAERWVDWTNTINVTVTGDTLKKTGGCDGCDDAGANSRQLIRTGDGYVEFSPGQANTFWLGGLSHGNNSARFADIDFAFRFNGAGHADVMENGVYQNGGDTTYAVGDVFRVAVVQGKVQYLKNGQVLHESRKAPEYPLVLDVSLGTMGTTVRNAKIGFDDRRLTQLDRRTDEGDRFAALDANRDGVISVSEWRASRRSFDQFDVNRDGVVSRREFYNVESEGVGTSGELIYVDPNERWTDTGAYVNAGDLILFDAEGTVQMSTDRNDVAYPGGARSGRHAPDAPLRQEPAGSLIARIGNSGPIFIGDRRSVRAPMSGRVYLGVNDDYLVDNSGEFRVMVTVEPR